VSSELYAVHLSRGETGWTPTVTPPVPKGLFVLEALVDISHDIMLFSLDSKLHLPSFFLNLIVKWACMPDPGLDLAWLGSQFKSQRKGSYCTAILVRR
jgi:hypothetical protein